MSGYDSVVWQELSCCTTGGLVLASVLVSVVGSAIWVVGFLSVQSGQPYLKVTSVNSAADGEPFPILLWCRVEANAKLRIPPATCVVPPCRSIPESSSACWFPHQFLISLHHAFPPFFKTLPFVAWYHIWTLPKVNQNVIFYLWQSHDFFKSF